MKGKPPEICPPKFSVLESKVETNESDIAKIVVSTEKMNFELGQVRDRLAAIEADGRWVKMLLMASLVALMGLVINAVVQNFKS